MLRDNDNNMMEHENFIAEPPTKGVSTEPMGLVNSGALVKRIYEGASPFSFVRELVQNSLDAGANRIEIGPDFVGVETAIAMGTEPVYKLSFSDNGHGIPRPKMKTLLNNLSSSGRNLGADANFGIGAKVSALPWNPYGMVFMSWTEDDEGMVRLFKRTDGNYGLFRFNESDEDSEDFVDLTTPPEKYQESWQRPSGTTVVLLGKDKDEDTLFGPPSENPGLYALLHVVNDRYFTFPEDAKVTVCAFDTGVKSRWPKSRSQAKKFYRQANGGKWFLDKHSKQSGTVKAPGAKIHWWWHPGVDSTGFDSYTSPLGYVAALYDHELYDVARRTKVGKKKSTYELHLVSMYAKFGLFFEEVWKNVTIVIEPDKYSDSNPEGVLPDLARNQLKMPAGGGLPWDQWGKAFADKMPEVIQKAIEKASEGTGSEINLEDKIREYLKLMDFYAGEDPTRPPRDNTPRRKPTKVKGKIKTKGGGDEPADKPTKYNLPARTWVKSSQMAVDQDLFQGKAIFYAPSTNQLFFNLDFPLWKRMETRWVEKYPKAPGLASKVAEAVKYVYETSVVTRIVHVRRFKGSADWSSQSIERALSNEALTMAILGIQDADTRIASFLKGTIKMKRLDRGNTADID